MLFKLRFPADVRAALVIYFRLLFFERSAPGDCEGQLRRRRGCACLAFTALARAFPAMACKAVFSLFRPLFRSAAMGQVRLGASKTSRTYPNVGIQEIKPRYGCVGCKLVPYKTLANSVAVVSPLYRHP